MLVNELYGGGIRALLQADPTLFDNFVVPEGVDADAVINCIIFKYGNTPLFSFNPAVMKFNIATWSRRRLDIWTRFKNAIELEYNPIENYDRIEDRDFDRRISADNSSEYQPDNDGRDHARIHGNIGVTTSQQMLTSELDLLSRLDIIEYIAEDFKNEFCLLMY